jgi:nitrite reductase/ring-hydroxylating ferredoxin subunit
MTTRAAQHRTNALKRLFCIAVSPPPADPGCWEFVGDTLTITLERAPELAVRGGALRLEDARLPDRVLVIRGQDGQLRAFRNRCACGGFRIDPVPDEEKIRCCTLAQSTYDYAGSPISGPAKKKLDLLPLRAEEDRLVIELDTIRGTKPPHARPVH